MVLFLNVPLHLVGDNEALLEGLPEVREEHGELFVFVGG